MGLILIFFGKNATGKSALIENTQKRLGLNVAHTRRLLAETNQTKTEKELLIQYEKQSQDAYLDVIRHKLVKKRKNEGLIIEGPFSVEEIRKIQSFFPKDQTVLIQLTSDSRLRISRLAARHNLTSRQAYKHMHQSDQLRQKKGIESLERISDIILSNNSGLEELYKQFHEKSLNHQRQNLLTVLRNKIQKTRLRK